MNLEKKWIQIQAYKHNGELHRQWSHGFIVKDDKDFFIWVSVFASVIEHDGRKWHAKEPAVFIMSKKDWYNVIAMLKPTGVNFYVNLASPTIYDKGYLKYIDYDLDVKLTQDGTTKLLDVSEYQRHSQQQVYGDDIGDILTNTLEQIYMMMGAKNFPFDENEIKRIYNSFEKFIK